jgi:DNA polymerase-1
MYGQTGGGAAAPLALMRRRFPKATALLDDAAREGERGRLVRSHLGRTCPPPSERWQSAIAGDAEADATDDSNRRSGQVARARGRFTRNFVIQSTAAVWAVVLLALLRQRLRTLDGPELVFFQHDEVLVHAPREHAPAVAEMITQCATGAGRLVFGPSPVRFPMSVHSVECYGDAK